MLTFGHCPFFIYISGPTSFFQSLFWTSLGLSGLLLGHSLPALPWPHALAGLGRKFFFSLRPQQQHLLWPAPGQVKGTLGTPFWPSSAFFKDLSCHSWQWVVSHVTHVTVA